MKKALKIIGGMFAAFFLVVLIILVIDISNDVEYKVIEDDTQGNGYYIRVETDATTEDDLRTIVEEVKKDTPNGIDATWLWIYKPDKDGTLLAKAMIPHNKKGQIMVGADNSDYIFEMKSISKNEQKTDSTKDTSVKKEDGTKTITWSDKVKEVANKEGSANEKFDEVSLYAHEYKPTQQEIADFEGYIIKEYKSGKYLSDISNHEYMLSNIFKSQVVEEYYTEGKAMKDFAFDFWQNSKYVYRGVDTVTSEATLSNEDQMNKALAEMGK